MKIPAILAFGLSLSACVTSQPATLVERGYAPGALAVAAIQRADWAKAEDMLVKARHVDQDDPARLINLGKVLWEQGRTGEAMSTWRLALASRGHYMVETADGRWVRTDAVARQALQLHGDGEVRTASR